MSCGCGCGGGTGAHATATGLFTSVATVTATPGFDGGPSPPVDTFGADLIVVHAAYDARFPAPAVSDSEANTWIQLSALDGIITGHRTWYAKQARGSHTHRFTVAAPRIRCNW
jgi:hypothetical protein